MNEPEQTKEPLSTWTLADWLALGREAPMGFFWAKDIVVSRLVPPQEDP